MADETWPTAITKIEPNRVRIRGVDIAEAMGRLTFGGAVHLLLTGDIPSGATASLLDAILVSSIDHGATPPSAQACRTIASTGASLSACVAGGVLAINQHHGGAIQAAAEALARVVDKTRAGANLDDAASAVLNEHKSEGRRFPGFGHRIHTKDPRTARLFELAMEAGLDQARAPAHIDAAKAVERAFASAGKALPINVDGAIGAVLADLGYEPAAMNGLFMVARSAGLVAHACEEQARMRPMRRIDAQRHVYDGPADRSIGATS